ncbi:hypothetical protein [Leptospira borgpetersenii]|uniref:hypothetical protein n=2 Tax=Leptospira borgpetersenii TaxID=174 RepID=UPI0013DE0958|nr:hypothetical protein [Leptospira borgpetersenii]MBE8401766.1 hypothetical protein [Leptospira borgpetersenii serovar Tarassovi]
MGGFIKSKILLFPSRGSLCFVATREFAAADFDSSMCHSAASELSFTLRVACNEIEKERSRAPHKLSWNNKNLWIAYLSYAKSLRSRSAIYGYLALYGSLDKKKLFCMIVNKILEKIENTRGPI